MRRKTQHQLQEARHGKVPRVTPRARPQLALTRSGGYEASDPIQCGTVSQGDAVVLVRATGMIFGIRAGQQRWVVGEEVWPAIATGALELLSDRPPPPPEARPTKLPDGTPGYAPELPGRIDQWPVAFTPCLGCGRAAEPGETLCAECTAAAAADETPLERALRLAGA